ncbi:hypothetical protein [Rhodococcus sp. USK10]|uniref:hypothetical protein n=1 Tax=Rhodococcus sp. USK10 TaxID=2789739 RepID=UPI002150A062|nr:hypothetical protein [Rhodococcus sp. USK10]
MSWAQLTVALDLSTPTASGDSTILVGRPGALDTVRMTAPDLREAQRKRVRIRAGFEEGGTSTGRVDVLLDVAVHIATDARTARSEAAWAHKHPSDTATVGVETMVYVGTPRGLASLILDIRAADVADGVTIVPAVAAGDSRDACVGLLLDEVLPILETHGLPPDPTVRPRAS